MILELRFSNFYSVADEAVISFEMGKKPTQSGYDIFLANGDRINKAIAVVGANGAGKTQLVKAFAFLNWFTTDSFLAGNGDSSIPYAAHSLHKDKPTVFSLRFLVAGEEYKYEVSLHNNKVLKEALYQKTSKYFSYVFVRESTEQGYRVKQQAFGFPPAQAQTLRANASLLAAAQSYGVLAARPVLAVINRTNHNLNVTGRHYFQPQNVLERARCYYDLPELSERMNAAICEFDLGIAEVSIRKMEQTNPNGEVETLYLPVALHKAGDRVFELPFLQESTGTQSAFVLLSLVLPVLMNGGLAVIDEIDNDLHPHMLPKLLDWFRFEHTNPHQAQIIFTCHTPEVINLLSKHQVYLVEKEEQCTQSWRLDEVKGVRADDNLYAKYMAGALSAVPNF